MPGGGRQAGRGGAGLTAAQPVVSTAIVGALTIEELRADLGALSVRLDDEVLARLGHHPRGVAVAEPVPLNIKVLIVGAVARQTWSIETVNRFPAEAIASSPLSTVPSRTMPGGGTVWPRSS